MFYSREAFDKLRLIISFRIIQYNIDVKEKEKKETL